MLSAPSNSMKSLRFIALFLGCALILSITLISWQPLPVYRFMLILIAFGLLAFGMYPMVHHAMPQPEDNNFSSDEERLLAVTQLKIMEAGLNTDSADDFFATLQLVLQKQFSHGQLSVAVSSGAPQRLTYPFLNGSVNDNATAQRFFSRLTEAVIISGKPLLMNAELYASQVNSGEIADEGFPDISWLGVPLCIAQKTIGAIILQAPAALARYSALDLNRLESLAGGIALVVQHLRKHQDARQFESLLRGLMDNIPDRIYFKDLDSRFILVNKATAQKHNFEDPAGLIGLTDKDLFSGEHALEPLADEQNIIRTRQPLINKEKKELLQDGSEFWSSITKAPLFADNGSVIGTVGISRDITNEKAAVEKLDKYAEELRVLNKSKDRLFSIIAHDLRSPFHPLLGLSELISSEIDTLSREEIKKLNDEFNRLLRNQFTLLENLLSWSRMQIGKVTVRPVKLDARKLTDTVFQLLHGAADAKAIALVNKMPDPVLLCADQTMLQSVLQNLVSNAIKFTRGGGLITVSAQRLDNLYEISVNDTGVGIAPGDLPKLFSFDVSFTSHGTNDERGTGLGLLICKEMVEKHGGTITVSSVLGEGTTFLFTIPAWTEESS